MSNVVRFRGQPSGTGGSRNGHCGVGGGGLSYLEDRQPDAQKKAKSFLDPREVVEFSWQGTSFAVSLKIDERESSIVDRFPRAVERVLKHIHAFYFESAFSHLPEDDPGRTPFIVESVKDWSAEDGVLSIVFCVLQPNKKGVAGKFDGENADDWRCEWCFKPV